MDFFPHDVRARADRKLERLIDVHGASGIGIFWTVIEMLYGESNHKMRISDCGIVARRLNAKPKMVESVIKDFDLFVLEGEFFYSSRVNREILAILEKSAKAKKSAEKRWNQKKADTVAMRSHDSSNANSNANREDNNIGEVLEEEEVPKEGEVQTKNDQLPSQENSEEETMTPEEIRKLRSDMDTFGLRNPKQMPPLPKPPMDEVSKLFRETVEKWPNKHGLGYNNEYRLLESMTLAASMIGVEELRRAIALELEYYTVTGCKYPYKLANYLKEGHYRESLELRQSEIDGHKAVKLLKLKPTDKDDSGYPESFVLDLWERLDAKARIAYKAHLANFGFKAEYGEIVGGEHKRTGIVAFTRGRDRWPAIR